MRSKLVMIAAAQCSEARQSSKRAPTRDHEDAVAGGRSM